MDGKGVWPSSILAGGSPKEPSPWTSGSREALTVRRPPATAVDGPLLPLHEPSPCSAMPRQRQRNSGPRLIRARPLGESIELLSNSEDSHSSDDEHRKGGCCAGGRRDCGQRVARGWSRFVAAARRAIEPPPSEREFGDGGDGEGDGDGGGDGEAAAAGSSGSSPPVSFCEGVRHLFLVLTWDIIHPDSKFRNTWDGLIVFALLYVALVTTYLLCFEFENDHHLSLFEAIDAMVYGAFLMDIPINFRTALRRGEDAATRNTVLTSRRLIAADYLTGWFLIDILAALPWAAITQSLASYMQLLKLLRLVRLVRLLNVSKEVQRSRLYQDVEQTQGAAVLRVVSYIMGAVIILHMSASAWFFVAVVESKDLSGTWAAAAGLQEASNFERYLTSLYFVVITFTTVGYGDVFPVTTAERFMTCVGMLIGVVTLGYIISTANSIAGAANKYEVSKTEMLSGVEDFLNAHSLPTALAARIKTFYGYVATKQFNDAGDEALVADLPCDLRREVLRDMHSRLIGRVPFLRAAAQLHEGLVLELTACLKLELYGKGQPVVMEGGWDTEMYFVTEGRLQVRQYEAPAAAAGGDQQQQQNGAGGAPPPALNMVATSRRPAFSASGSVRRWLAGVQARGSRGDVVLEMYGGGGIGGGGGGGNSTASQVAAQPSTPLPDVARQEGAAPANGGASTTAPAAAPTAAAAASGSRVWGSGAGRSVSPFAAAGGGGGDGRSELTPLPSSLRSTSQLMERRRKWRMLYDRSVPYKKLRQLKPGQYFGEYGCLTGCPRTASVIAVRMTELYCLRRSDLAAAMARWPGLAEQWKRCEEYSERERERLRLCLQGGRAPWAVSMPDSRTHTHTHPGEYGGGWGDDHSEPYDMAAEAAVSSHKRYQDFLSYFGGGSGRGGADELAAEAMSGAMSMSVSVAN